MLKNVSLLIIGALVFGSTSTANASGKIDCNSKAYAESLKLSLEAKILRIYGSEQGYKNLQKIDKKMNKGSYKSAQKLIQKTLELQDISDHLAAKLYATEGQIFFQANDIEKSVLAFSKAYETEPKNTWDKKRYQTHINSLKESKRLYSSPRIDWIERKIPKIQFEVETSGYCQLSFQLTTNGTTNVSADFCTKDLQPEPFIEAVSTWQHKLNDNALNEIGDDWIFTRLDNNLWNECGDLI